MTYFMGEFAQKPVEKNKNRNRELRNLGASAVGGAIIGSATLPITTAIIGGHKPYKKDFYKSLGKSYKELITTKNGRKILALTSGGTAGLVTAQYLTTKGINAVINKIRNRKRKSNFSTAFRKTANFGVFDGIKNKATADTHKLIDDAIDYGGKRLKDEGSKYAQEFKSKIPEYWKALKKNKTARRLAYGFAALQGLQALTGIKSGIELAQGGYRNIKRLVTRKPKEQTAKFSAMVHVPNRQMKRGLSPDEIKYLMKIGGKTALGVGVIGGGIYGINKLRKRKKFPVRK